MVIHKQQQVFSHIFPFRRSFIARLFGRLDPRNAFIEVNNAIAEAERPSLANVTQIQAIHQKYGASSFSQFLPQAGKLYSSYLMTLFRGLAKTSISQQDIDDLQMIQHAFLMSDAYVDRLNLQAGRTIYRLALAHALDDEILTEHERDELAHLGRQLNLDDDAIAELYSDELQKLLTEKVEDALEDGELSPDEEYHIQMLCKRFDINPRFTVHMQTVMDEARRVWMARRGPLSGMTTDLALKRGEECYGRMTVEWWEVRRNAMSTWRSHHMPPETASTIALAYAPIVENCLTQIDTGTIYITNKRVLFVGQSSTSTIPYSKMIDVSQFRNGIKINKETGRSPYIISNDPLILGALVKRMLFGSA